MQQYLLGINKCQAALQDVAEEERQRTSTFCSPCLGGGVCRSDMALTAPIKHPGRTASCLLMDRLRREPTTLTHTSGCLRRHRRPTAVNGSPAQVHGRIPGPSNSTPMHVLDPPRGGRYEHLGRNCRSCHHLLQLGGRGEWGDLLEASIAA